MTIRYSLKRTQFKSIANSNSERKIIDYQATQAQIVPILAFTYANIFMAKYCNVIHDKMHEEIKNNKFSLMKNLHILISCLKAYYMQESTEYLFVLRE